ncbi:MAG TPA: VTT domain-containing protein, partial [Usitatibacter sp.]|nr:VTT domain-containing protein [Usitatibacter sp.]
AAMLADHAWFFVGRRHGRRLLETLCRVSISPDTCVSRTDAMLGRYGPSLLLFAKFIPGVSAVTIPTLAAMRIPWRRFIAFDAAGCAIWCGAYLGAGAIFSREIDRLLGAMSRIGIGVAEAGAAILAVYLAAKFLERRRLQRVYDLVRIAPPDLARLLRHDREVVILDARSQVARASDPRALPNSLVLDDPRSIDALPAELRTKTVVTFCTCPNEASAALVASLLLESGYPKVRVLTGGERALDVLAVDQAVASAGREGTAAIQA